MRTRLNSTELEPVLEKLFKLMEDRGLKIDNQQFKNDIIHEIAYELNDKLTPHDINTDPNVQKKLMACITSKIMGKDDDFNLLINNLQSDPSHEFEGFDVSLDKKLKAEFFLLTLLIQMNLLPHKLKLTPKEFHEKIVGEKEKSLKEDEKSLKYDLNKQKGYLEKLIDATLRNIYGGDNPTINGEVPIPILGPIIGNLFAFTNRNIQDPTRYDLMTDIITYNSNKFDYLGMEGRNKIVELAEGGIDLDNDLAQCDFKANIAPRPGGF